MRKITEIGAEANQRLEIVGENNERITFKIYFRPSQQGFYFDIIYQDFVLRGQKVLNAPNLLNQYRDLLPFGLTCFVADGSDPFFADDFVTERAILFLLNEEDVAEITERFYS